MQHTFSYQNHQLQYYIQGNGHPILFLHGWPTNATLWTAQVEILKEEYKTITLDWLGFGQSDKPLDYTYTFSKKKEILDELLSKVLQKEEKVTLVAHDLGGPAAILWASENPNRVERLILLNTMLYTLKTPLDAFSEMVMSTPLLKNIFVSQFGLRAVLRTNTKSRGKALKAKIEDFVKVLKDVPSAVKLKTIQEPMHIGRKQELRTLSEKFEKLSRPKHLILAKEDPLCFAHIKKLSLENPDVPTYDIPNCGHFIPIDQPHALTKILQEILQQKL